MSKFTVPVRIIPHEQYIKAMMLSGLSHDDIRARTALQGFTVLNDRYMDAIADRCKVLPGGKEMMLENKKRLSPKSKTKEPYILEKTIEEFKYSDHLLDIIYHSTGFPLKKHHSQDYQSVVSILANRKERTFLEIAELMNVPIEEIQKNWARIAGKKRSGKSSTVKLSCYNYFYWRFTLSNMREHGASRDIDVSTYLDMDSENTFYETHKELIFTSPAVLYSFFGLLSDEDRMQMEKEEYGRCHNMIMQSFYTKNYNLPPWVVSEHSRISEGIRKDEGVEGKDFHRKQLDRIFTRIVTRSNDHTLAQIKRNESRLTREPEQDEPAVIKRKQ